MKFCHALWHRRASADARQVQGAWRERSLGFNSADRSSERHLRCAEDASSSGNHFAGVATH